MSRIPAPLILGLLLLGQGCYLNHGFAPLDADAREDATSPLGTTTAPDATVLDARLPEDEDAGELPPEADVPTLCERMCAAMEAGGCVSTRDCMPGCLGRAEQAERVDCLSEWKRVTQCIIEMPCSDGICGMTSGWPECIGARP